jgi:hypothetical protein
VSTIGVPYKNKNGEKSCPRVVQSRVDSALTDACQTRTLTGTILGTSFIQVSLIEKT